MSDFRRVMSSKVIDLIVRIAVIVSVVVSSFAAYRWQELTRCVATYNDVNNQRTVILTDVSNDERRAEQIADNAQAALFLTPILSKPSDERSPAEVNELRRLFTAYQKALAEQAHERAQSDNARKSHPIPPPPKDVCGSPS